MDARLIAVEVFLGSKPSSPASCKKRLGARPAPAARSAAGAGRQNGKRSGVAEAERDEDGAVDAGHCGGGQFPDARHEPPLIDGPDLLQQNDAVLGKPERRGEFNVRGEPRLVDLARDGGGDDGGGILVARIVLHHQHGAHPALFAPHNGGEIGIIQFSAFDDHTFPLP